MDDLSRYVLTYYGQFMTPHEWEAKRSIYFQQAQQGATSQGMRAMLGKKVSQDPEVLALLADGDESFYVRVRDRILREHSSEVFLNRCPKCGALARTPRAKQCRACFYSWHEKA